MPAFGGTCSDYIGDGGGGNSDIVSGSVARNDWGDGCGGSDTSDDRGDGGGSGGAKYVHYSGREVGDGAVPRSGAMTMRLPERPLTGSTVANWTFLFVV